MRTPEETVATIDRVLRERVDGDDEVEDLDLVQRVLNVISSFEVWSDIGMRRLHEIHRLTDSECSSCTKYLDAQRA